MIRRRAVRPSIAGVLALVVVAFATWIALGRPTTSYYVPSDSMAPTIRMGDRILARGVSAYSPHRFDIVVFDDPGGWLGPAGGDQAGTLLKRVIGLPGETVSCCAPDGRLRIDGVPLDESGFLPHGLPCDGPEKQDAGQDYLGGCTGWSAVVPPGSLFVMGDNRTRSADSAWHLCSAADAAIRGSGYPCYLAYVPIGEVVAVVVH